MLSASLPSPSVFFGSTGNYCESTRTPLAVIGSRKLTLDSIFETHYKTTIVMCCFFVTTGGWFAWNGFLDGVYAASPSGPYAIRDTFTHTFGADATWWATLFMTLSFLGLMDIVLLVVKRNLRITGLLSWTPWKRGPRPGDDSSPEELDMRVWQELEQDPVIRERLRRLARDDDDDEDDYLEQDIDDTVLDVNTEKEKGSILEHFGKLRRMIPIRT